MKTKLSLALFLALAVPALAAGTSISFDTGTFQSGTLSGTFSNRGSVDITIRGSLSTIEVKTGTLTPFTSGCPAGSSCFLFSSGATSVSENGTVMFTDSLSGGITISANGSASISASLADVHGITSGDVSADFVFNGTSITSGSGDLVATRTTVVPEAGTLLLFSTGLFGVAATLRKRYGRA